MTYNKLFLNCALFAVLITSVSNKCFSQNKSKKLPNILFIMSDDHTSQSWGIYDEIFKDYVINNNIKRLADEGIVLNNAFCTNSICVPSRSSIMTGQYSHKNGIYTLKEGLSPDSLNIAKVMQSNGYQTAIIGKWHLKNMPTGFDFFKVLPGQGVYNNPRFKTAENWENGNNGGQIQNGFSTDIIADESIKWLDNRDPNKPFFLMTHFKAAHEPYDFPEKFKDLYKNVQFPEPENLYDFGPNTTQRTFIGQKIEELVRRWETAAKEGNQINYPELPFEIIGLDSIQIRKKAYQKLIKDYLRCTAGINDNLGKILQYLDQNNLTENTVVIYTSDQGYFLGEHGFFDKRMFLEESLRMPFVIRYPKEIKGGIRIDDIILNIDIPALIADYGGLKKIPSFQGVSFRDNLLQKTSPNWRTSMYYRYYAHSMSRPAHFGIRNKRYKLIFYYGLPLSLKGSYTQTATVPSWEFYDLLVDPKENYNEYQNSEYIETIQQMKKELIKIRIEMGDLDLDFPEMNLIINKFWG